MNSKISALLVGIVTAILSLVSLHAEPQYGHFKAADSTQLRYASWKAANTKDRKITILLLQGRASFIEKNIDFIEDLNKLGFSVITFDWRGMGGSGRTLNHPQKSHIDSFDTYLKDVDEFIDQVIKPSNHDKLVLFGASFGGQLALRYLRDYPGKASAAILSGPMLDVYTDPLPHWLTEPVVKFMCLIGYGEHYAFGQGDFDPAKADFSKNKETGDEKRFWKTIDIVKQNPQYVIGGVTFGWVKAAFESMNKTRQTDYLQGITQPVLLMTAGEDRVVLTIHDHEVCHAMPRCNHKVFAGATHNLMKERELVRSAVLRETDNFIAEMVER